MPEIKLKPCPFCGGEAQLQKIFKGCREVSVIIDEWIVTCKNKCCSTHSYKDIIYHADNGEVIIEINGAEKAIEAWNRRTEK